MKFTIELDDFWIEDEELSTALSDSIKTSVIYEIQQSIKDQVESKITDEVKSKIQDKMDEDISILIDAFIATGKIKSLHSSSEKVSVREYIEQKFNNDRGWSNPSKRLDELAAKMSKEMRDRYDLMFASQIVNKLNSQGLLKDGVAETLLNGKQ